MRGELRIEPLTEVAERFAPGSRLLVGGTPYTVEAARRDKSGLLIRLEGVDSRTVAEELRGRLLEIPEREAAPLEEGEYFRYQIVGIDVFDTAGRALGRVEEVLPTGSNDVYVVRGPAGELLLPAIEDVIREVDVAGRRMVVELIEGLEPPPRAKL